MSSSYTQGEIDDILRQTLDDGRVSRAERRALNEMFADLNLDRDAKALIRSRVFALAQEQMRTDTSRNILEWVEGVIKVLFGTLDRDETIAEAHFSPGDQCRRAIGRLLRAAQKKVDICVFTITDNELVSEITGAHERGIRVRIVSDNDKSEDRGSDIERIARAGVEVCVDASEHHMHHKFAVVDSRSVLTGSYNWTRSAALHNRENILVLDHSKVVREYQQAFDELWESLSKSHLVAG